MENFGYIAQFNVAYFWPGVKSLLYVPPRPEKEFRGLEVQFVLFKLV